MSNQQNTLLTLELTGNPWTDFGIVSLCSELRMGAPDFLVKAPLLTDNEATITIDISDIETVKTWLYGTLRDKWNNIHHKSLIAKLLKYTPNQESGFINPDEMINITDVNREVIEKECIKRKMKRKKKIEDKELAFERRSNFVGRPGDIKIVKEKLKSIVDEIIESLTIQSGKKHCKITGLPFKKDKDVTQYVNPFTNKHHYHPPRGTISGAGYNKVSPIHYFVNMQTTLCPNIPFVRDAEVTLILPVIPDLHLLSEIYNRLLGNNNLKDLNDNDETRSSTNLRDLRAPYDDYSLAIYLFHNIFYRFSKREKRLLFDPINDPERNIPLLTRWVKIPFTRPRSPTKPIQFGNFHHIEIDHRLYKFIRPISFSDSFKIRLVPDILFRIRPTLIKGKRDIRGENSLRYLSKAIATSNPKLMKVAIFHLWKHSDGINIHFDKQTETPHPLQMFRHFIQYFLKENAVLNAELREDLRALGNTIGKVFSRDVTLISKLYNASSENAFKAVLKQIMFRLYKTGLLDGKIKEDGKFSVKVVKIKNEEKSIAHLDRKNASKISDILDQLTQENWAQIAETLSTFTSLSAFSENLFQDLSKRKAKGEKND